MCAALPYPLESCPSLGTLGRLRQEQLLQRTTKALDANKMHEMHALSLVTRIVFFGGLRLCICAAFPCFCWMILCSGLVG